MFNRISLGKKMMAKPWIFGIGSGKTGGHSLAAALYTVGLKASHVGHECYHGRTFIRDTMLANKANRRSPTDGIDGIDAIVDWPVHEMFRELDSSVRGAKFILTYRPPDDCAISWCRMIGENHKNVGPGWPKGFKKYGEIVRSHVDSVLQHFFGRPESLLILDARDSSKTKWKLLGDFLGVETPADKPYPKEFDHEQWQVQ